MLGALAIVAVQLLWVQASRLAAVRRGANQRTTTVTLPAVRGAVVDRNGNKLAYTLDAKALTFQPVAERKRLEEAHAENPEKPEPDERLQEIAEGIHERLGDTVSESDLLEKLRSDETFVYLARSVDPAIAADIGDEFQEVGLERQDIREYPGGSLAANVVGATGWDGHGLLGLEASLDSTLAGKDGSETHDRGSDGAVIPGSRRDLREAVDGSTVELTLDSDLQYYVQQQTQQAKDLSARRTRPSWCSTRRPPKSSRWRTTARSIRRSGWATTRVPRRWATFP